MHMLLPHASPAMFPRPGSTPACTGKLVPALVVYVLREVRRQFPIALQEVAPCNADAARNCLGLVLELVFLENSRPMHRQLLSAINRLHPSALGAAAG